jgi:hypothetical protein
MQSTRDHARATAVWADALFVSVLQHSDQPDAGQVRQAVAAAVHAYGGQGCAQRVAQEFGEHPETAVSRMRWARDAARQALAESAPQPGPSADPRPWQTVRPRLPAKAAPRTWRRRAA